MTFRFGRWAFSPKVGFYAGLFLSTCIGLFLFTRIVIPDVILTLSVTVSLWAFLRALDGEEEHPRLWAYVMAASLAAGLLLKSLIGLVFPLGVAFLFLLLTRRLFDRKTWQRLYPFTGFLIFIAIAAPWHVLATIRNPPYFDFTMHAGPGQYHGFFWFYFINEQVLRFLNARYPRDYNTVPRLYFWLLHLVWLFPWSVYLPTLWRLSYKPMDRQGRARLLALCWIGFVMVFFTLSTTQEYYSMPIYPALALLLACGVAASDGSIRVGARVVSVVAGCAAIVDLRNSGERARAADAGRHFDRAHAKLRRLHAFARAHARSHAQIIRIFAVAPGRSPESPSSSAQSGAWRLRGERALLAMAVMMVIFFQATRLALVTFDPYLSSRPIAEALNRAPRGKLVIYGNHNAISSLLFYSEDKCLMLNGRYFNLEYGSYAPDAPPVFINDDDFSRLWSQPERWYLALSDDDIPHVQKVVARDHLHLIAAVGGKSLFSNLDKRFCSASLLLRLESLAWLEARSLRLEALLCYYLNERSNYGDCYLPFNRKPAPRRRGLRLPGRD